MATITEVKDYKIKVIFLIHLFLACLICLGLWQSDSVFFYNVILILCLAWSIHRSESEEPLQMALVINLASIFFDIGLISSTFPQTHLPNRFFSEVVCLITLICRPCTAYVMAKEVQERRGIIGPLSPFDVFLANGKVSNAPQDTHKSTPSPQSSPNNFHVTVIS